MKVRSYYILIGLVLILGGAPGGHAFSLLGPLKPWQVSSIGYDLAGDIGGPMDATEAYRWNVPTLVYAFDTQFLNYFGPQGVEAIEEAIEILNNLPPASEIANDSFSLFIGGERVPFDTKRVNFQAQALGILDIKSVALTALVEELGLAEAERWVYALRARTITDNGNVTNYTVIKLNYDPITLQPSSYVNNVLYTYQIVDNSMPQVATATEIPLDPLAFSFSSVSGGLLSVGEFYTGLTHDDVGGLRYLYRENHFVNETLFTNNISLATGRIRSSPWTPVIISTNLPGVTNVVGGTNINYVVQALRPGIEKFNFVRGNFDSLLGQFFIAVTNHWTDRFISNGVPVTQVLQRAVVQPDIIFSSADLGLANDNLTPFLFSRSGTGNWINNDAINGLAGEGGPGNIVPPVVITYSNKLPFFGNQNPDFLDESFLLQSGIWGSFDGTTNAPIIYPQFLGWTLEDLRNASRGGGRN